MKKKPLEYALYLIELRDRSVGEIRQKMRMKNYEDEEIETTLRLLLEKDFLNDERLVTNIIRNNKEFGTKGKYKIRQKLIQLKISSDLVQQSLSEINSDDELSRAQELAEKWLAKKGRDDKTYERLGRFLAARGFEIDVVKSVLSDLLK